MWVTNWMVPQIKITIKVLLDMFRMASFRSLAVLCLALATALPTKAGDPADDCTEACWERCFQVRNVTHGLSCLIDESLSVPIVHDFVTFTTLFFALRWTHDLGGLLVSTVGL